MCSGLARPPLRELWRSRASHQRGIAEPHASAPSAMHRLWVKSFGVGLQGPGSGLHAPALDCGAQLGGPTTESRAPALD
eukprot:109810-Alexandrium_andersonii.AAC.1